MLNNYAFNRTNLSFKNVVHQFNAIRLKQFGLVSLFNGISTFVGYLMLKAILLEEQ